MLNLLNQVFHSLSDDDRVNNFVAVGSLFHNDYPFHSALIIKCDGSLYEFGFSHGRTTDFSELENEYFHKVTDIISSEEVPAFLAQCKRINNKARPYFGYFYSGQHFDTEGNIVGDRLMSNYMSCVGFCIAVLKTSLENDYLQWQDWEVETHLATEFLNRNPDYHDFEIEDIENESRRITPIELFASAFFVDNPIRKNQVDPITSQLQEYFTRKFTA